MNQDTLTVASEIVKTINTIPVNSNSVVVYDIDGTLLDWNGNPITPIVQTYHHARNAGLIPVIITARAGSNQNIDLTRKQLYQVGISDYKYIYFLPEDKNDQAWFKLLSRKNLHDKGYEVVMSIGDMPWDIGQYGGIGFRV